MDRKMNAEEAGLGKSMCWTVGWNTAHKRYKCKDGMLIEVPCKTAYAKCMNMTITFPSNIIRYVRDAEKRL